MYTRQEIRSDHHKVKFSDGEITKIEQLWKDFDRVSVDAYLNKSSGVVMGTVDGSFGYFTINPLGYDNLYTIKEIDSSPHKEESDGLDEQIKIEGLLNDFDYVSMAILVIIMLIAGILALAIYYKNKTKRMAALH